MKDLKFEFTVEKSNHSINIKREVAAEKKRVWAAWTSPDILDKWWAPKPWKSETKQMDFSEGGIRLYAMVGPEGEKHWSVQRYNAIQPEVSFKSQNFFTDQNGKIEETEPSSDWTITFKEENGKTILDIFIQHSTTEDLEKYLQMGFKEGFTMCLENLDEELS